MKLFVFHPGTLGDLLLTRPILAAFHRQFSGSTVHLLARKEWAQLLPEVDRVFDLEAAPFLWLFREDWEEGASFLKAYDVAIFWSSHPFRPPARPNACRWIFASPRPPRSFRGHVVQWLEGTIRKAGFHLQPHLDLPPLNARRFEVERLGVQSGQFAVFHPGSGSRAKNWELSNFLRVARFLEGEQKIPVVWTLGPAEEGWEKFLRQAMPGARIARLPISSVASLLLNARLFLGNDSGIAHLAAQQGILTVVLFLHSDPAVWCPVGRQVIVISTLRGEDFPGSVQYHPVQTVEPDDVCAVLREAVAGKEGQESGKSI
jgi:ADP-heptose:LPS heptosyltransferase